MSTFLYPVALDLQDRPVLVVGAGRMAARKLPELLLCGARVKVIAPKGIDAVRRLSSSIDWLERFYQPGDEVGMTLVFALTDSPEVNAQVHSQCLARQILCNRADSAAASGFHVPGVIRRGAVTFTAATGGAAPGLTRWLKRRLETLFGAELPLLVELLGHWRQRMREGEGLGQTFEKLPYGELMNAAKSGREAAQTALEKAWTEIGATGAELPNSQSRSMALPGVTLVGAGPGHPDLITVLGAQAVARAEVILHDRLIPPETLGLAPTHCLLVPVEKRGHQQSMRQEHINALLVDYASQGKRVVRLKGGDPFVFGRGYEEILALEAAGLPWTVIPGLSSSTAVPAWAGLPLTHRGVARSFAVMTGTVYDAPDPEIPKADTVVVVMGLQRLPAIVAAFLKQGYAAETPAVAIEKGTRPDQRLCHATLANLTEETAAAGFDSPVLIVIGAVAGLRSPSR